jgi:ADP-heptose:LPS heptosyltransferase
MAGIYHQMDVLVSAGREGFGLPYLEGRAAGCRLVLPQYSAHFSMHYPDTITYSCPLTRPEGAAPDVLDIEPDVPNLTNAMVQAWQMHRASGGPPPLPETLSRGLQWSAVSHRLREMIVAHGQSKPRLQFEEAKLFMAIPLEDLQPEKLGPKKRICIVMPRSAGDVLLTTAVAHSLKNHKHRDCELDFVTSSQFFGLLEGCPWIDQIVEFNPDIHGDYHRMGRIYEAYYTPYFRTQVFANWVHGGYGKSLAEVYADDCGVALGEYWCPTKRPEFDIPMEYITFHPGSGTGEQSARWYERWEEVVSEITIPVVQIGTENEPLIEGCVDLRGKTNYAELHHVIQNAKAHLGIDSYPMHIAAILATPIVTIWGNTFPSATGPANALSYWMKCIEPKDRGNCRRPCHYTTCVFGKPCMNNIEPSQIIGEINEVLS